MLTLNRPRTDEAEESPTKIRRQQPLEECHKLFDEEAFKICDLPTEVLEKIVSNINPMFHHRLRATCKRLKDVSEAYVMHEFEKILNKCTRKDPKSEESAVLRIINVATEVYRRSGFVSTFCLCIPPILQNRFTTQDASIFHRQNFLREFYDKVEFSLAKSSSQRCRLLYAITLMRLINAADRSIISVARHDSHSEILFELKDFYLRARMVYEIGQQHTKWYYLLRVLAEVAIYNISDTNIWPRPSYYIEIIDYTNRKTIVRSTTLSIKISGSEEILNLFHSCLQNECEELQWPAEWPTDEFSVKLEMHCKHGQYSECYTTDLSAKAEVEQPSDVKHE